MNDNLSCYFCTTPYQVMGALSIAISNNDKGDIYIVPQFIGAKEIASKLQKLGIFNRVKVVDLDTREAQKKYKIKYLRYLRTIKCYCNVDKIVGTFLSSDVIYQKIYISSQAYVGRMACLYYIWHDLGAEIILFDDGEGSYDNKYIIKLKLMDRIAQYLLGGDCISNHISKIMLFNPDIYKKINKTQKVNVIEQINFQQFAVSICRNLREIFNVNQKHVIKEKVIIIDTIACEALNLKDINHLYDIYKLIYRICGDDNVIIKPHPRNKKFNLFYKYYAYNIPIEELCLVQDFTDKLMITLSSTAVTVPKLLFNQEPFVILLHKIISPKSGDTKKREEYYAAVCMSYSNEAKIFVPKNLLELEDVLCTIMLHSGGKI